MNATSTSVNKRNLQVLLKGIFFLVLVLFATDSWAQTYYTRSNTNGWNNANAWEVDVNGTRNVATNPPTSVNPVVITRSITLPTMGVAHCKNLTLNTTNAEIKLLLGIGATLNVAENIVINSPSAAGDTNSVELRQANLFVEGSLLYGTNTNNSNKGLTDVVVKGGINSPSTLAVKGNIANNSNANSTAICLLRILGYSKLDVGGTLGVGARLAETFAGNSTVRFSGTSSQTLPMGAVFGNVNIANSAGVSLSEHLSPTNLAGNLIVESGQLEDRGFSITGKTGTNGKALEVWAGAKLILSYSDLTTNNAFPAGFTNIDLDPASTVVFNGTAVQKIAVQNYGNLEFLGGVGKSKILLGNTTAHNAYVAADLLLDLGSLNIGDNTLTLTTIGSIKNPNATRYIILGTNGRMLVKDMGQTAGARNTEVTFPIGTATGYSPAYLTNSGALYDFTVRVEDGVKDYATNTMYNQHVVNKTWDIECLGQVFGQDPSVKVKLQWNKSDEKTPFDRTNCFVTHYKNGWQNTSDLPQAAAGVGGAPFNFYSAEISGISSFSPFSIGDGLNPLPVELTFFKAARKENAVLLNWETASEKNCLGYDVLASADGKNFEFVGNITSKNGNASYAQQYEFTDKTSRTGLVYYRLKQTDLDGTVTYYATQVVDMGRFTETLVAFPNPFQDRFELKLQSAAAQEVLLQINDLTGKTVYQMTPKVVAGETVIPIELSQDLPAGIYILTAKTSSQLFTSRLIKQ